MSVRKSAGFAILLALAANHACAAWYLGNVHCHSSRSGDVRGDTAQTPAQVAAMYRAQGFDFLCISDHDFIRTNVPATDAGLLLTDSDALTVRKDGRIVFLGITGSEVSVIAPHIGAPGLRELMPKGLTDFRLRMARARELGAVPILNHPRWNDFLGKTNEETARVIYNMGDIRHMEIWNTDTHAPTLDPSTEQPEIQTWDLLLNRGMVVMGLSTDDEHYVGDLSNPETAMGMTGAIMVRAATLCRENILDGMRRGDFYAVARPTRDATWCTFREVVLSSTGIFVDSPGASELQFVVYDMEGEALAQPRLVDGGPGDGRPGQGISAGYAFTGTERYARAVASNADGAHALSQAAFRVMPGAEILAGDVRGDGSGVRVLLSWRPSNHPWATGQTLLRSKDGTEEKFALTRFQNDYVDRRVALGETWTYRVATAYGRGYADVVSESAKITATPPAAPILHFDDPSELAHFAIIDDPSATDSPPSRWRVADGVLQQNSNIFSPSAEYLGTYAMLKDVTATDYVLAFDLTPGDDDSVGCVWRYEGPRKFYALQWDCQRELLRVVRFDGTIEPVVLADLSKRAPQFLMGVTYHVEAGVMGPMHHVTIRGGQLQKPIEIGFTDALHRQGPPGLCTWGAWPTNFDNLSCRELRPR